MHNHLSFLFFLNWLYHVLFLFSDQAEARRMKVKEARKRREERIMQKKQDLLQSYADEATAKK